MTNWSSEPDDIENQQAVRLAKMADPDGERTIGRRKIGLAQNLTLSIY